MRTAAHIARHAGMLLALSVPLLMDAAAQERFRTADGIALIAEPIVTGLQVPWSLAFSDSDLYFTERPGRISVLRGLRGTPVVLATIHDVTARGEGGLMGLALHPDFEHNHQLYVSHTREDTEGRVTNRVVRFTLKGDRLGEKRVILDGLPAGGVHNGCRLAFGPDGKLYITTGDAAHRAHAQDTSSLGGKILRLNPDGTIPPDNPFGRSPLYSIGHRNPQGIAWQPVTGLLFSSEHGPSGFDGPGGGDEINIIRAGRNYGWPLIHHRQHADGLEGPLLEFTPAVAPAGMTFISSTLMGGLNGSLLVATLRGAHILRVTFKSGGGDLPQSEEKLFADRFGRLRDIVQGPDGCIYFCTSNRDGRGSPGAGDDKILKLDIE